MERGCDGRVLPPADGSDGAPAGHRASTVTRQPIVPWKGKSARAGTGRTSNPSACQTATAAASSRGSSKVGTHATRRPARVSSTALVYA